MIHHLVFLQLQIFKYSLLHLFCSPDHCLSWFMQDLPLSWNMPAVHERERAHPPHQPHLWCSPHFGWPRPSLAARTLWISVWPTTNTSCLHRRSQALLSCVKSEGSTFLPALELSSPGHPSFAFFSVTHPKRLELQSLSSPVYCPSVTFPNMLFDLPSSLLKGAFLYQCNTACCETWAFHTPAKLSLTAFHQSGLSALCSLPVLGEHPLRVAAGKYLPPLNQTLLAVAFKFY